jgi:hypothetical protein
LVHDLVRGERSFQALARPGWTVAPSPGAFSANNPDKDRKPPFARLRAVFILPPGNACRRKNGRPRAEETMIFLVDSGGVQVAGPLRLPRFRSRTSFPETF